MPFQHVMAIGMVMLSASELAMRIPLTCPCDVDFVDGADESVCTNPMLQYNGAPQQVPNCKLTAILKTCRNGSTP